MLHPKVSVHIICISYTISHESSFLLEKSQGRAYFSAGISPPPAQMSAAAISDVYFCHIHFRSRPCFLTLFIHPASFSPTQLQRIFAEISQPTAGRKSFKIAS